MASSSTAGQTTATNELEVRVEIFFLFIFSFL
jgi:hypothetical protein